VGVVNAAGSNALRLVGLLFLVGWVVGCTRVYEAEVIRVPCGNGYLVIHERHERGKVSRTHFEMHLVAGGASRLIDRHNQGFSLYARPTPVERYRLLRQSAPEGIRRYITDDVWVWVVFVDPRRFTPAEYEQISQVLSGHLDAIDAACARLRPPERGVAMPTERRPVLVATRYVDPEGFRKLYQGPPPLEVEVAPDGAVIIRGVGEGGETRTRQIGHVIEDGQRILLTPELGDPWGPAWSLSDLGRCRDPGGRTLHDDFVVEQGTPESYWNAEMRWWDRRSEFHDVTRDYARSFSHPGGVFALRFERSRRVVLVGSINDAPFVREFGHVVDRDQTFLLLPAEGRWNWMAAGLPAPGIPDRATFVTECRDENGNSPLAHFALELAADLGQYRERAGRTWTRATGP
jgi:hypothetical protein